MRLNVLGKKVLPQKFPYPYQAAIAFKNDCEFQTEDCYQFFQNSIDADIGFNIKISHSLFFYTTHASCHSSISYFEGTTKKKSQYAGFLKELNQSGLIDTIHAYGDFDKGGFDRALALNAYETALADGLNFSIYSNHGSNLNKQNMGHIGLQNYQEGDLPDSHFYHADLTDALGINYFWVDEASDLAYSPRKNLLYERQCRDKKKRKFFWRYRGLPGLPAPNLSSFRTQVSKDIIYKVIESQTSIIFYQHFGVLTKLQNGEFLENKEPFMSKEDLEIFNFIGSYVRDKIVWNPYCGELLNYEDNMSKISSCLDSKGNLEIFINKNQLEQVSGKLWFKLDTPPKNVLVKMDKNSILDVKYRMIKQEDFYAIVIGLPK